MTQIAKLALLTCLIALASCENESAVEAEVFDENSSSRRPNESFDEAEGRFRSSLSSVALSAYQNLHSVKNLAVAYDDTDFSSLTEWDDYSQLEEAFEKGRDERFLTDASHADFPRRSTWLYPDNGCYARGDLLARNLISWGYPKTSKIFVFGELAVTTANSPTNSVGWWYHTAPIASVSGSVYVLDPAVYPASPIKFSSWISLISTGTTYITVSVCATYAYGPGSQCLSAANQGSTKAISDQNKFLDLEWERLVELGRNPEEELGENPPWTN